jgi:Na+/H+-translocating membrane pyrophosphatase
MISVAATYVLIYVATVLGLIFAFVNYWVVRSIKMDPGVGGEDYTQMATEGGSPKDKIELMVKIGGFISQGANAFLYQEYKILAIFCLILALIIKFAVDQIGDFGTTIAFLFGAVTSVLCGFLGMRIAVFSNYRTAYRCQVSLGAGFLVAFRAGCVMGFSLVSLSLTMMTTLVAVYRGIYASRNHQSNPFMKPLLDMVWEDPLSPCSVELVVAFTQKLLMSVQI